MRTTRSVAAALVGIVAIVPVAAAHPGHGLDVGFVHELTHAGQAALTIAVVLLVAAVPGLIATRKR